MAGSTSGSQATASTAKTDAFVEYVGSADVAKISAADWKKAKVEGQEQVVWDADNEHKVKVSDLSADALKVLAKDSRFKVPSSDEA